jgi:hypothetical protein
VPERHTELLEIDLAQLRQDIGVDFNRAKERLVLSEAETSLPTPVQGRGVEGFVPPAGRAFLADHHVIGADGLAKEFTAIADDNRTVQRFVECYDC